MPLHAVVVREYVFHNKNRGDEQNQLKPKSQDRTVEAPKESIISDRYVVPVDMTAFGDDGENA